MSSIRRQLLGGLLGVVVLAMALAASAVYLQARAELDELFDYHLKQMALSLRERAFEQFVVVDPRGVEDDFDFVIQVWRSDGVRLYFSHPHAALPGRARLGFETITTPEGRWRVFSVQQRGVTAQVGQPMRVREQLALTAALRTLAPFLILMPVLGVLVWLTVGRGLRPLEVVATAVKARTPASLHPLPEQGLPDEVRPLVSALNGLLDRLSRARSRRRSTGHSRRSGLKGSRDRSSLNALRSPI